MTERRANYHFNMSKYNELPVEDRKYLLIPFEKKDCFKKKYGLKWDSSRKQWYTNRGSTDDVIKYEIVDLEVPFKHKDYVKGLGCRWNGNNWFTTMEVYEKYEEQFSKYEIYREEED